MLEREVSRVSDDFKAFGALVREIGQRVHLLSQTYDMQLAVIGELSALRNVVVPDTTPMTEALSRRNDYYNKVLTAMSL